MTYNAVTKEPSGEKTATTPAQSINITTDGEVPLIFQMSSATVDVQITKRQGTWVERNLLDSVWLVQQKAVGFNRAAIFGDGSIAQCSHVVLPPGIGHGYNGRQSDFPTYKEFAEAQNGCLIINFPNDFFTKTLAFTNALGIPADVTLNKRDTWKENKYRIDQTGAEYIFLWSEVKILPGESWQSYLVWAKQMRDSISKYYGLYSETNPTGKKLIADEPNMFQGDRKSVEWRLNINPTSLTGIYAGEDYWQSGDQAGYTPNMDSNIVRVRYYLDSIMTKEMAEFKRIFPGWKLIAGQVQPEDRREDKPKYILNTIVGDMFWSGIYEVFVENQTFQPMAVQESMKNCSDPNDPTTKILTLLNSTLKPDRKVTTLTFTGMPDCTGYALRFGNPLKSHCVVINNWSRATYTLSQIMVNGNKKTPVVTAIHHTSLSWRDAIQIDTTISETFSIPPGVTVLNYTLK